MKNIRRFGMGLTLTLAFLTASGQPGFAATTANPFPGLRLPAGFEKTLSNDSAAIYKNEKEGLSLIVTLPVPPKPGALSFLSKKPDLNAFAKRQAGKGILMKDPVLHERVIAGIDVVELAGPGLTRDGLQPTRRMVFFECDEFFDVTLFGPQATIDAHPDLLENVVTSVCRMGTETAPVAQPFKTKKKPVVIRMKNRQLISDATLVSEDKTGYWLALAKGEKFYVKKSEIESIG